MIVHPKIKISINYLASCCSKTEKSRYFEKCQWSQWAPMLFGSQCSSKHLFVLQVWIDIQWANYDRIFIFGWTSVGIRSFIFLYAFFKCQWKSTFFKTYFFVLQICNDIQQLNDNRFFFLMYYLFKISKTRVILDAFFLRNACRN